MIKDDDGALEPCKVVLVVTCHGTRRRTCEALPLVRGVDACGLCDPHPHRMVWLSFWHCLKAEYLSANQQSSCRCISRADSSQRSTVRPHDAMKRKVEIAKKKSCVTRLGKLPGNFWNSDGRVMFSSTGISPQVTVKYFEYWESNNFTILFGSNWWRAALHVSYFERRVSRQNIHFKVKCSKLTKARYILSL